MRSRIGAVAIVGAGIAGMQAALDLAESGVKVYLIDSKPGIGGVMSMLDKTFPTNDCAMCTMAPRLVSVGRHKDIEVIPLSDVQGLEGEPGNIKLKIRENARYVKKEKCTGCGECVGSCPVRNKPNLPKVGEVALAQELKNEIDGILEKYKYKDAPLISVLQEINVRHNFLPEEALRYLSLRLNIPLAHIIGVATFYAFFSIKPRGRHVISVCEGTTCFVKGAGKITERLQSILGVEVGETTKDGKFSLDVVRCLGCCALAPVVKIDDRIRAKARLKDVEDLLRKVD